MPNLDYLFKPDEHRKYKPGTADWRAYWDQRRAKERTEAERLIALSDATPGAFREGFLRGYLQAYEDTQEYGCPVETAKIAHALAIERKDQEKPLRDVEGW